MSAEQMVKVIALDWVLKLIDERNGITIPLLFVRATGSHVIAAVLARLLELHAASGGGKFRVSDAELCEGLVVSTGQLRMVRAVLAHFGLSATREGIPARVHYRIDVAALEAALAPWRDHEL